MYDVCMTHITSRSHRTRREMTAFVAAVPLVGAHGAFGKCGETRRPRRNGTSVSARVNIPSGDLDAVVIGSGMGGLTTAAQLAAYGARVGVLESYIVPGGSSASFSRGEYKFDVGASMIFGLGSQGTTNLLTRALALVDAHVDSTPDPTQVVYHIPGSRQLRVHRDYDQWISELTGAFPAEEKGIRQFYATCWRVFDALNAMPLLSLEEPAYLLRALRNHPAACLQLTRYLASNVADAADAAGIRDPDLRNLLDLECYSWSVARASHTPLINAGMVFSDRHYGGIRYPTGGVGTLARALSDGIERQPGCWVRCGVSVSRVEFDASGKAIGVRLRSGQLIRARVVISNATRWDTFHSDRALVPPKLVPQIEHRFRQRYTKSPSFVSVHLGIRAADVQIDISKIDCHHILLDDWQHMESARDASGTLFVSIPTVLDASVAPPGHHIVHAFVPSWLDEWSNLDKAAYIAKKSQFLHRILTRLQPILPGIQGAIDIAEIGTPRTHRRFLNRSDGTYGPVPIARPAGLLAMPFNRTAVPQLYCAGDSTFPGQGLNATAFSGFSCGHRVAADLGLVQTLPAPIDQALTTLLSNTRLRL